MRKPYRTDLTDAQWKLIKPLIPPAKPGGNKRAVDIREVVNGVSPLCWLPVARQNRRDPGAPN